MQIGLCSSAIANASAIAKSGVDFIEENVQSFLAPEGPEDEFVARLSKAAGAARTIPTANCFLPASCKCTGPTVDLPRILRYAECAFTRAQRAGIDTIVFGSGGARALDQGVSKRDAVEQLVALLKQLGPLAQRRGVTVVLEPLNSAECNFINSLAEGAEVVSRADHPNVRLLADIFHMLRDHEPPEAITRHGALIGHVHIAEHAERTAPGVKGDDFRPYLKALRSIGYDHRLALECGWKDLGTELNSAVSTLRRQLADCGF